VTQAREVAAQPNSLFRGWGSACAIFFVVVLVALAASTGVAWQWGGERYLPSALTAWALCWTAALIALAIVIVGRVLNQGIGSILFAMGVRMGLPLALALYLVDQSPGWTETKLMPFLLGNYFLALIAETGLALHLLQGVSPLGKPLSSTPAAGELSPKS
jgi:hypothetical protein